jgi:hypothetical protein
MKDGPVALSLLGRSSCLRPICMNGLLMRAGLLIS